MWQLRCQKLFEAAAIKFLTTQQTVSLFGSLLALRSCLFIECEFFYLLLFIEQHITVNMLTLFARAMCFNLKDFMGKSDPFLQLSKLKSDGGALLVHRTEVSYCRLRDTKLTIKMSTTRNKQTNRTVTLTRQFMLHTFADLYGLFTSLFICFFGCDCQDAMGGVGRGPVEKP